MTAAEQRQLSKLMSLILRHEPERFGLALDGKGWVGVAELLAAIRKEHRWSAVTEAQVREVVTASDKQRFEVMDGRIRARYGHSVAERVTYPPVEPPERLYHGTAPGSLAAIRREGLRAMGRHYVHLSTQVEQAHIVGRRHSPQPVVLTMRAREAWQAGVLFYQPEERLYLAKTVPAEFLEALGESDRT